jgi:hypothetical protein
VDSLRKREQKKAEETRERLLSLFTFHKLRKASTNEKQYNKFNSNSRIGNQDEPRNR